MKRSHHKHLLLHLVLAHHTHERTQSDPKFIGDKITSGMKRRIAHTKEIGDIRNELSTAREALNRFSENNDRTAALSLRVESLEKRLVELER